MERLRVVSSYINIGLVLLPIWGWGSYWPTQKKIPSEGSALESYIWNKTTKA